MECLNPKQKLNRSKVYGEVEQVTVKQKKGNLRKYRAAQKNRVKRKKTRGPGIKKNMLFFVENVKINHITVLRHKIKKIIDVCYICIYKLMWG